MRKNFNNIENDEAYKDFRIEDYLPSVNMRNPEDAPLMPEQKTTVAEKKTALFPSQDKPDTPEEQEAITNTVDVDEMAMETSEPDSDIEVEANPEASEVPSERTIIRRISSKQRRLSLDEYRSTFLQVPKIADRKPVFVSHEVRDRLDRIVRYFGGRGMSVSGLVENLVRHHLATYGNDIDQWRKL